MIHEPQVKPVRYFGQRNGARHNPYAAGVKKYELNGGRFNNDATTAYDLPRPIKSRGGRPIKNSPGSIDTQSDNSGDSTEQSDSTGSSIPAVSANENAATENSDAKNTVQNNSAITERPGETINRVLICRFDIIKRDTAILYVFILFIDLTRVVLQTKSKLSVTNMSQTFNFDLFVLNSANVNSLLRSIEELSCSLVVPCSAEMFSL